MGKNSNTFLWIGIAGVVAFLAMKGAKAAGLKSIRVSPSGFDVKKKTVSIEILNPSSQAITVKAIVADISLNGAALASVDTTQGFTINALGKKVVTFPLNISPMGLVQLTKMILNKTANLKAPVVTISGSANVLDYVFPFDAKIPLW